MITKTEPMKHQREAMLAGYGKKYFGYLMDPGLGKTKVQIDEAYNLWNEDRLDTVIVVCPKSIMSTWVDEIDTHHPGHPNVKLWRTGEGFIDVRSDVDQAGTTLDTGPTWWIVNTDAITPKKRKNVTDKTTYNMLMRIMCAGGRSLMVVDESTTIKNPDSKRSAAIVALGHSAATYRRILTGTPIANTPLDIYGQAHFLDPMIYRGWSFFAFQRQYAIMGGYENRQVLGYRNQKDLLDRMAPHCFRASKADHLDLPPRTTQVREVELPTKAWKAYRAIVDELVVLVGDSEHTMSIDMVIKKITKLRQLTGGWVKPDALLADKKTKNPDAALGPHHIHNAKIDVLKELLDECSGQPTIIWCQFVHEILAIKEILPSAEVYYGAMDTDERDEAKHRFNNRVSPYIIIQNDTGSMGLTINTATVSIFFSNPIYPLSKEQARDRNYRKGQDLPVTEYELIVKGSIDETIYNNLINKRTLADGMVSCINSPENFIEAVLPKKKIGWKAEGMGLDDSIGERPR